MSIVAITVGCVRVHSEAGGSSFRIENAKRLSTGDISKTAFKCLVIFIGRAGVERGEDGISVSQVRASTGHKIVDAASTASDALVESLVHRSRAGRCRFKLNLRIKWCLY